jgi:exonuclease III
VYIIADEPVDVRRKNTLTRLKAQAERDGDCFHFTRRRALSRRHSRFSVTSGFIHTDIAVGDTITNTRMADLHPCTERELVISSYNCRGLRDDKLVYVLELLHKTYILYIQENWLSDEQLSHLKSVVSHSHVDIHGVCGFSPSKVLSGRLFGSCAVSWHRELNFRFTPITENSRRICALHCVCENVRIVLINVYLPFENDYVSEDEFCIQLSIIDDIIQRFPDCFVICGGDFNVDFQRDRTHNARLNEFCRNMPLQPAFTHSCSLADYAYNFNMHRFSIIDHFLVSEALFDEATSQMYVRHEIDNRSDHDPIFMHLSIIYDHFSITPRVFTSRFVRQNASKEDKMSYQESLRTYLSEISLPTKVLLCHNTVCCHAQHDEMLSLYARNFLRGMSASRRNSYSCHSPCLNGTCAWLDRVCGAMSREIAFLASYLDRQR